MPLICMMVVIGLTDPMATEGCTHHLSF